MRRKERKNESQKGQDKGRNKKAKNTKKKAITRIGNKGKQAYRIATRRKDDIKEETASNKERKRG